MSTSYRAICAVLERVATPYKASDGPFCVAPDLAEVLGVTIPVVVGWFGRYSGQSVRATPLELRKLVGLKPELVILRSAVDRRLASLNPHLPEEEVRRLSFAACKKTARRSSQAGKMASRALSAGGDK